MATRGPVRFGMADAIAAAVVFGIMAWIVVEVTSRVRADAHLRRGPDRGVSAVIRDTYGWDCGSVTNRGDVKPGGYTVTCSNGKRYWIEPRFGRDPTVRPAG